MTDVFGLLLHETVVFEPLHHFGVGRMSAGPPSKLGMPVRCFTAVADLATGIEIDGGTTRAIPRWGARQEQIEEIFRNDGKG
jgi:hypothetical protein